MLVPVEIWQFWVIITGTRLTSVIFFRPLIIYILKLNFMIKFQPIQLVNFQSVPTTNVHLLHSIVELTDWRGFIPHPSWMNWGAFLSKRSKIFNIWLIIVLLEFCHSVDWRARSCLMCWKLTSNFTNGWVIDECGFSRKTGHAPFIEPNHYLRVYILLQVLRFGYCFFWDTETHITAMRL